MVLSHSCLKTSNHASKLAKREVFVTSVLPAELKRFEQEYQRRQEEELHQRRAKEEAEKRKEFERLKRIADRDARYDAYHEKANSTGGGLLGSLIVVFLSLIVGLAIIWSMAILAIGTS